VKVATLLVDYLTQVYGVNPNAAKFSDIKNILSKAFDKTSGEAVINGLKICSGFKATADADAVVQPCERKVANQDKKPNEIINYAYESSGQRVGTNDVTSQRVNMTLGLFIEALKSLRTDNTQDENRNKSPIYWFEYDKNNNLTCKGYNHLYRFLYQACVGVFPTECK
jgi:hypothetical protein